MGLSNIQFTGYEFTLFCEGCRKNHWQWKEWPKVGEKPPLDLGGLVAFAKKHIKGHKDGTVESN